MGIKHTERTLNKAFVVTLHQSPDFVNWLLGKTKFRDTRAELLSKEPWEFRWYKASDGTESETDIYLVFRNLETKRRFSLHIENKLANSRFQNKQPELYHVRARDWMNTKGYVDYEAILIAPQAFYAANKGGSDVFDRYIPHEEIASFVPIFRTLAAADASALAFS